MLISIGNNEIGIVYKKWGPNLFLHLPPGRIIALNGEPGIQAEILEPGLHPGYPSLLYTITKVPVIKISQEEIGLIEAKDGNPLEVEQNFGKVVDCNNFQDIEAFFNNGGQIGKQRAILTNGTYRINTEMFSCRKVPLTKIEPHQIGLVEAQDGSPLKPGKNFGHKVNCNNFQDAQAFFDNGGQVGKQIDILLPGTYKINTDLFKITPVEQLSIGTEEIGLVEAKDGVSLKSGESFGKVVDCNNFQDGSEFIRKGGQRGKQRAILMEGTYQINTELFEVRTVPITDISSEEIGLVETQDGKPLEQGENFAKKVDCNNFQDAQAFFDNGGQAGKQLATLRAGKYYINTDIFNIKKVSATTISPGEIGLVETKYGKPLEEGKNFAKKVDCNNFQDAQAFFDNGGQAGKQIATLEPGTYYINPEIFTIRKVPIIRIPQGEIGLVIANEGASKSDKQTLGRVVECNNFQDAEAFLKNGGQKGKQLAILSDGDYKINTDFFTVITTANANEYKEEPEKLKIYKISSGQIGIVTTNVGKTLSKDEIAGPIIEGHDNYQNAQKFLDLGGYIGLQEEVIKEGEWKLNPWFVKVEQVPITRIKQDEVGVVISFVGKKYDKDDDNQNTSVDENKSTYQLVPEGYQGVEKKPLLVGDYPINTRIKKVQLVPTTQIILNWSDEEKHALNYDAKLKTLNLTSYDGRKFEVQFTQMIRIAPENAPKMICQIGAEAAAVETITMDDGSGKTKTIRKYPAIRNLVVRVLTRVVEGHFKQAGTGKTAIEFQKAIVHSQDAAQAYIEDVLKKNGVEGEGTYINAVDLPEDLNKHQQEVEDFKLEQIKAQEKSKTIEEKIRTEQINQQLVQTKEETKALEKRTQAETDVYIAKKKGEAHLAEQEAIAKANKLHTDLEINRKKEFTEIEMNAFRAKVAVLSPEFYKEIETQGKWAEAMAQMEINYPQIMMTGGGNSSSGDPTSNYFQLLQLDHLETLRNRLNPGTSTPLLSTPGTKNYLSPNQKQKRLPAHSAELKTPVVLVVDTSTSMSGERIDFLNAGIASFKQEFEPSSKISQSLELAIITSNSNRRGIQDFVNMDEFIPSPLKTEAETMMGKGINLGLQEIENYQDNYQSNNIQDTQKPWLFYIIGIPPTDPNWQIIDKDWQKSTQCAWKAVEENKLNFFVVNVQGVDSINLIKFGSPKTSPKLFNGFPELFRSIAENLKKSFQE
ncbi:MAG: hypothetical protein F6K54_15425 [Okeania sp. SIO3B5]|uniref:SPFH domain-containing protein n=1 Tax=Okeania sp. SIO3B5 TaxID=2607811 RepID=UPI0013FF6F4E|nr:SPFH domain-containing protein [Okeania sp. SIO3B5]NEO54352.1 hypothetical protein [Okeania sp. SIO3B5]